MKVGVIMGGPSSEREISLLSGEEMLKGLDTEKYEPCRIELHPREQLAAQLKGIDFALLALHGSYGEDGTIQAELESLGIPYSGSGAASSSLCMDKHAAKTRLHAHGIPTPKWLLAHGLKEVSPADVRKLGYPVFVKPNAGGSSVGTLPAENEASLRQAFQEALRWDSSVLIEEYIEGQEITCSILGGELLPILGIRSKTSAGWFDYKAKYEDGGAEEQVIHLPADLEARVRRTALDVYRVLECSVYARIDMMLKDGIPYVLEANTLPGMTPASLLPKSAAAAGISFSRLLDRIIELSLLERASG
ncbi:D-alanine--D-alanine ligase [Paenibacillus pinistramenti]|uniref:D-alanine--D-alanine ligase n=1 Tax=Paenibacillus pinistramenti TaxID=1768003 RepID=UPI001107B8EA|nr:D-alanine--D-alanine ligase [Paenibacillus pinistramenti]